MWGLRVVPLRRALAGGMFPTHVGIARMAWNSPSPCWNVPYACGDCAGLGRLPVAGSACSLRMWGLRDVERAQGHEAGMFPTHVGIARLGDRRIGQQPNVPYACGDCALTNRPSPRNFLCSLRMWGLRGRQTGGRRVPHMFPTHVGIARRHRRRPFVRSDVPYACGDCASPRLRRTRN